MATCKDCLHVEVCKFKDLPAPLSDSYIRESECIENRCGNFKDHSRFVELPCGVGDTVYYIKAGTVQETIVTSFRISRIGIRLTRAGGYGLGFDEEIGRKIFFTYEEAEQALAKQNQPDNTPQ